MEWVACVGIDWGAKEHSFVIEPAGDERIKGSVKNSPEEVHAWIQSLRGVHQEGTIVVAVEAGCNGLIYALSAYPNIAIVPINPRASKAYRESRRLSGASSDGVDAELILDFTVKHLDELRVWKPDDWLTRKLRRMVECRRAFVDQRTAMTHTLAAVLREYFPQALQWFGGESSPLLRAFLTRWPSLELLLAASAAEVRTAVQSVRRRKIQALTDTLMKNFMSAVAFTRDLATIESCAIHVQSLIPVIDTLDAQIARYDAAIAELWSMHPDREIFDALPGAGPVMAPRLAVAFGRDRDRFECADELQCYSGIAPVTEKSGRSIWIHARWAFPTFLHQTFHEFAQASLPKSPWAKAVYQEQRDRGAGHHEAIRAVAFRWIRILFRLWKDDVEYDETYHLESLKRRHSPIARRMAA